MNYFVSRHAGAIAWAEQHLSIDHFLTHLVPDMLVAGDKVYGTLPVHLVAQINLRGGEYYHLTLDLPEHLRGQELSAKELERFAVRVQLYRVCDPYSFWYQKHLLRIRQTLRTLSQSMQRFYLQSLSVRRLTAFMFAMISLICIAWLGDQSYFLYQQLATPATTAAFDSQASIVSLLILLISSALSAYLGFSFIKVRHLNRTHALPRCEALILTASPLGGGYRLTFNDRQCELSHPDGAESLTLTSNLAHDIEAITRFKTQHGIRAPFNWQQALRAILAHHPTLRHVVLICSEQLHISQDGKTPHAELLAALLRHYVDREHCQVEVARGRLDKDSIASYYTEIEHQINRLQALGISERAICIDNTAGQVPASMGACLATLHNQCHVQYFNNQGIPQSYQVTFKQIDA
ncbi:CRISPR-associated protein Csx16 [Pseudoalteromonas sp. R3]|uniref:CRISPR-associated protein Csx16 n=1 Tax=Pseudoalteromonas sp. R3 TaxID=1709477 RepID=UPI0009E711E0|nr:CRISPR-associated protein Csx16 [Pseudoalteromonas sp. R3]AZZ97525.1 CRISPR-associated protein Csx16 [Pseudoalteromonas sp. R3]